MTVANLRENMNPPLELKRDLQDAKKPTCTALFRKQLFSPGALSSPFDKMMELVFLGCQTRAAVGLL